MKNHVAMINAVKKIVTLACTVVVLAPLVAVAQLEIYNPGLAQPIGLTPWGTMLRITNIVLSIVAILTVLVIIVSGILYITSGGDSARTETAKGWLFNAVWGLVVVLVSYAIVVFISQALGAR